MVSFTSTSSAHLLTSCPVFGSPRAPGIPIEEATISQLDINFALNWTARNIEQFGGDPNKGMSSSTLRSGMADINIVTIMGESAGALAVGNLVNTVPNNPPFRAAIEMSGSSVVNPIDFSGSDPDAAWPALVELLNCTNTSDEAVLTCMRALPADTIQTAMNENQLMFTPQPPNNITILEAPDEVWAEGNVARVPLLIGYTGDDGGVFVREPAALATATNLSFADALTALNLPKSVTDILTTAYSPGSPFAPDVNTTQDAFFKFATDITFGCTSGFVANITSRLLDVPVWEYVFDAVVPSNTFADYPELGAWHAGELALLFGNYQRPNATELDTQVSQRFQKHFADFIKDPERGPGWEQWPQIGIIGVADGQAVTTTENVQQYNPVCQQYENLWLATEVPALAQAQPQPPQEGNGGQQEEEAVPSMASACSISGLSTLVVAVLFAVALI
jgi:carboxylesterase type B